MWYTNVHTYVIFFRPFHKTKTASTIQASRSELLRMTRGQVTQRDAELVESGFLMEKYLTNRYLYNIHNYVIYMSYITYMI